MQHLKQRVAEASLRAQLWKGNISCSAPLIILPPQRNLRQIMCMGITAALQRFSLLLLLGSNPETLLHCLCKVNDTRVILCHLLWSIFVQPGLEWHFRTPHSEMWSFLLCVVKTCVHKDTKWHCSLNYYFWKDNWFEDYINYLYSTNIIFEFSPVLCEQHQ